MPPKRCKTSVVKEIEISTSLVASRDAVEICVADSGQGVTQEAKERLFLPYFSTKKRGTGLGLAIVSRIVEDHHGSIRVEENRPVGARFVIELPIARRFNRRSALASPMHNILIVDDESSIRESLQGVLEDEGYKASAVDSGEACLEMLRNKSFDVILLDIWLPGMDGLEALERIRENEDAPEVVVISGHATIETAVRATKLGAFDFLEKPLSVERTLILIKNAIETRKLRLENRDLKKQMAPRSLIVGESIPTKALRQQIQLMAPTNGRVLIFGESGTGKELVAHAIHVHSLRKDEMFVEVNCAAIPEDLIESELFGHRRGSFAAASGDKDGKFLKANGGTLFLDEVGDMSLKTQAKVLRTLEEQKFAAVGSDEPVTVDVRVIASTNKDLEEEISRGNFREDLFYRLNVIPFSVPPLRERKEDIPLLGRHFLKELSSQYGRRPREIYRRCH